MKKMRIYGLLFLLLFGGAFRVAFASEPANLTIVASPGGQSGETSISFNGIGGSEIYYYKITNASIAIPDTMDSVPSDLEATPLIPSGNIIVIDDDQFIHIYAIESGGIIGYGEHGMVEGDIKQPANLSITCSEDNSTVGNTLVNVANLPSGTHKYKITANSITDQLASSTVPGDAIDFLMDGSVTAQVGQFIHVWSVGGNTKIIGYGEYEVIDGDVKKAVLMGVSVAPGSAEKTTIVTPSDVPGDIETLRYNTSESSIPIMTSAMEEPTGFPIFVPGETEIPIEGTPYIHIYGSKGGYVFSYGQHMMSISDVSFADPLTATTNIVNNSYGTGVDDNIVFDFSAPIFTISKSAVDETYIKSNMTANVTYTAILSDDKKSITIDPEESLKVGKLYSFTLTNQFKDEDDAIFDGMTLEFTPGPKLDVSINDSDDLLKYTGQHNGNYYVMVIPTGSAATVPSNAAEVKTAVNDQSDLPYDHLDYVGHKFESIDDGSNYEASIWMLEESKEHTAYVAFKDSDGLMYNQLETFTFTTEGYTPLLKNLVFADNADPTDDINTVISLPSADPTNTFVYKITTIANPEDRPVFDTVLAGWTAIVDGQNIEVKDKKHVNVAEIDATGKVKKFAYGRAITKVEDPFTPNTPMVCEFTSQSTAKITYNLLAGRASTIYYAMYLKDADLGGLTYQDVLYGRKGAISTGFFEGETTGGDVKYVGVLNNAPSMVYGDLKIAYVPKVTYVSEYFEQATIATIYDPDNNADYDMTMAHKTNTPLSTMPGTGIGDVQAINTQVISTVEKMFRYEIVLNSNVESEIKLAFVERNLLKDKTYAEIKSFLKSDLTTYISENRIQIHDYESNTTEKDVSSLIPGLYTALVYNGDVTTGDRYGDFSSMVLDYAFLRTKEGAISVDSSEMFVGDSIRATFEINNIVGPVNGENFFDTIGTAITYDGAPISNPIEGSISWTIDVDNFKSIITAVYAGTAVNLEKDKSITFNLNEAGLYIINGTTIVSPVVTKTVKDIMGGVGFGQFVKSGSVNISNNNPMDVTYVIVEESKVANIPLEHGGMATFMDSDHTKIAHKTIGSGSNDSIALSALSLGTYKVFAYPVNYVDGIYISPVSSSSIIIHEPVVSSGGNNDDDDDEPAEDPEPAPVETDTLSNIQSTGDVNKDLEVFNNLIDDVKSPKEAKKSMDIIGKKIKTTGGDVSKLKADEKKKVIDNISNIIGNTEGLLEKLDDGADKVALVGQIMENTKDLIGQLSKDKESSADKKLVNQLNSSLVDLANKVIEEEGKLVLGKSGTVNLEDLLKPIEKGKLAKEKMAKILDEVGVDQELKGLKSSLLVKIDGKSDEAREVGFPKEALEGLAKEIDSLQIDFGNTGIQIDTQTMSNAKKNMTFSTEDIKNPTAKKPEGHEGADINVRQVEAYDGDAPVKAFSKPVKVSFDVNDFGFDPKEDDGLSNLIVMVLNEESGDWEPTGGVYDPITNSMTFYRIHMSKYTVVKNKKKFSDVDNSWAKDEINNLLGKGIVDSKSEFKPNETVTREEFASWISRAYGLKETGHKATFADIEKDNPYYDEIANACDQGLLFGRTKEEFAPKEEITREEMATLVARAISNYNDVKIPDDGKKRFASLTDGNDTSDWAVDNVAMVIDLGIMEPDSNGNFNPQDPISKEAAADIFAKLYK